MLRIGIGLILTLAHGVAHAQDRCATRMLVSGYFSNNVHIYNACSGAFERNLDDSGGVRKFDPHTGAAGNWLADVNAAGGHGLTYISLLSSPSTIDASQVGTQYFVTGNGPISGRTIEVNDVISTTGPAFGAAFAPAELRIKRRWPPSIHAGC